MRVGLVAEGRGDLAVLVNILRGKLGLDFEDIQFIRPEYDLDETDSHDQDESERGGWGRVKRECEERARIEEFFQNSIDPEPLVVVQIDTAEAELPGYDVARPDRAAPAYVDLLRPRVVQKIDQWLAGHFAGRVRYAVAVEETDAWVLTLHSSRDTSGHRDPKDKLNQQLNKALSDKERKRLYQLKAYRRYEKLTQPFRKAKELEQCAGRNRSLRLFLDSL
jgi:hypothetical protein